MNIWKNEFILHYPSWDDKIEIESEKVHGSYRDAIKRARVLAIKTDAPKKGSRREVGIYLGDCFLKGIG